MNGLRKNLGRAKLDAKFLRQAIGGASAITTNISLHYSHRLSSFTLFGLHRLLHSMPSLWPRVVIVVICLHFSIHSCLFVVPPTTPLKLGNQNLSASPWHRPSKYHKATPLSWIFCTNEQNTPLEHPSTRSTVSAPENK